MRTASVPTLLCLFAVLCTPLQAQTVFERTYGTEYGDGGFSVEQTTDGGYIITGYTVVQARGDFYTIKTDASGEVQWSSTVGGDSIDAAQAVRQTADGGFIVAGYTKSIDSGDYDVLLVKYSPWGDTEWSRTYGGRAHDRVYSMDLTADGGFIMAGYTGSFGQGDTDVWLIRTDAHGDTLWTKTYGGSGWDEGRSVRQVSDGGYIVAGNTWSFGGRHGYLIKTDSLGDTCWTRHYGCYRASGSDCVRQLPDGGYIVAGWTIVQNAHFLGWLLRLDGNGDTLWTRAIGGDSADEFHSVDQTPDSGFIVAGNTRSFGAGYSDGWLLKMTGEGDTVWMRTFGGSQWERIWSLGQTADGGFVLVGQTSSFGLGDDDVYLVKTDSLGSGVVEEVESPIVRAASSATLVRGMLMMPRDMTELPGNSGRVSRPSLLDATGRKVMELQPGANDVSRLAPGVYLAHAASYVDKVLVLR